MNAVAAWLRRWRATAPAGLACLLAAALLEGVLSPRWAADAEAARDEARAMRSALAAGERTRATAADPAGDISGWPAAARSGERVADMIERSLRAGVEVQRTQQRLDAPAGARVQVLRLQQNARGAYADLRRHVGTALAEDAALGLERVRLQRAGPDVREFDADLQWALVQRAGADPR